jgi:microcystin-dependent protein
MPGEAIQPTGGDQTHDNMPPYLGVNFVIAFHGIYPSRN